VLSEKSKGLRTITLRFSLILFSILTLCGYGRGQTSLADVSPAREDLREDIFRYMFKRYNYGAYVKVYCIQADRLLFDNFARRFDDVKVPVVWASECTMAGPWNAIQKKKTGLPGMKMTITYVAWLNATEVEAKVKAFSDGIAANENTLRLRLVGKRWVVVRDKIDSVS
jgi:hypothetical protein